MQSNKSFSVRMLVIDDNSQTTTNLCFFVYTAYLKKYGEFDLADFIAKRHLRNTKLLVFLHWFIPSVIGTEKWGREQKTTPFSTMVTVSDEAYLYIIVESNYDKWLYMSKRTVRVYIAHALIFQHLLTTLQCTVTTG